MCECVSPFVYKTIRLRQVVESVCCCAAAACCRRQSNGLHAPTMMCAEAAVAVFQKMESFFSLFFIESVLDEIDFIQFSPPPSNQPASRPIGVVV